jgi:hypothetical protein
MLIACFIYFFDFISVIQNFEFSIVRMRIELALLSPDLH